MEPKNEHPKRRMPLDPEVEREHHELVHFLPSGRIMVDANVLVRRKEFQDQLRRIQEAKILIKSR